MSSDTKLLSKCIIQCINESSLVDEYTDDNTSLQLLLYAQYATYALFATTLTMPYYNTHRIVFMTFAIVILMLQSAVHKML